MAWEIWKLRKAVHESSVVVVISRCLELYVYELSDDTVFYGSLPFEICFQVYGVLFSCHIDDDRSSFLGLPSWRSMEIIELLYGVSLSLFARFS